MVDNDSQNIRLIGFFETLQCIVFSIQMTTKKRSNMIYNMYMFPKIFWDPTVSFGNMYVTFHILCTVLNKRNTVVSSFLYFFQSLKAYTFVSLTLVNLPQYLYFTVSYFTLDIRLSQYWWTVSDNSTSQLMAFKSRILNLSFKLYDC